MLGALGAGFLVVMGLLVQQAEEPIQPPPPQLPASATPMLISPQRLAELRSAACYDDAGNQIANCTPTIHWADFLSNVTYCMTNSCSASRAGGKSFALAYLVTQNPAYRDKAVSAVMNEITNGLAGEHGQQLLDANRIVDSAAFVYSWLKSELSEEQKNLVRGYMNRVAQEVYYEHARKSPPTNIYYQHNQWGVSDETNNYFYAHLLVATYAGVATYGENDFRVPVDITNPDCSFYTNRPACPTNPIDLYMGGSAPNHFSEIIPFVYAKLDREGVPYLNTYGKGGGWQEGNQYGAANFSWSSLILQQAGFRDYFATTDYSREHVRFYLHSVQPGDDFIHPLGDAGREKTFRVSPYEREDMLVLAAGLAGTIESEYAQYHLNNIQTSIASGWQQSLFKNFLLQNSNLPERNYENELPAFYHAPGLGWINSRNSWSDQVPAVTFISTENRATAHQHKDQNSFDIYYGDGSIEGWQTVDANICSGSNGIGGSGDSRFHNSILVNDQGQFRYFSDTSPKSYGEIVATASGNGYNYWVGEAANAYIDTSNKQRTLSRFTREMVHVYPRLLVVYDRITPTPGYANSVITELFQYQSAPTIAGNVLTHEGGQAKIFQTVLLPAADYTVTPVQNVFNWSGSDHPSPCYRAELETNALQSDYRFLNVLELHATFNPNVPLKENPQPSSVISSTNQAMEGAFIQDFVKTIVMFSRSGSPVTTTVAYAYQSNYHGPTKHVLVNLKPDQAYEVRVNGAVDNIYTSTGTGTLTFATLTPVGSTDIVLQPVSKGGSRTEKTPRPGLKP